MIQNEFPVHNSIQSEQEILEGSILLIDKPYEWTSFDVVNKIKGACRHVQGLQKLKIGHAGTLDPLATGLLVICTGKMTKRIQDIQDGAKEYSGVIHLGKTTPSFDLETIPEGDSDISPITNELCIAAAKSFIGEQDQLPPAYSAKKIDGKRAYKSAHLGIAVQMNVHRVNVMEFEITDFQLPEVHFRIRCSKGTYIRSIANDFGKMLGCGGYLQELRRTESSPFRIEEALSVDTIVGKLRALRETFAPGNH